MLSLCFAVPNEDTNLTAVDLSSSIYAPLLGATPSSRPTPMARSDFNPRTPCGVRRRMYASMSSSPLFQSTHPLRGATCCVRIICLLRGVVYSVGLAFSASAANIADVGRFLQLLARIVIVCLTYCLAVHFFAGIAHLVAVFLPTQTASSASCGVSAAFS